MADHPGSTFRDYRGVEGAVDDADTSDKAAAPKRSVPVSRSNAVTAANVLKTERAPAADEGVRAFGAPLGTEQDRQTANQTTDSEN